MKNKRNHIIIFYSLVLGITCLFLNDRLWKFYYSNWMTGKLSDFLGLITLPIFIGILFPRTKKYISIIVGSIFVFWKSPLATPLIESWNQIMIFKLTRTIDYSDFLALIILPFIHYFLVHLNINEFKNNVQLKVNADFLKLFVCFSFLVFCSTSVDEPSYPKGDIYIDESIEVEMSKENILQVMKERDLEIKVDSIWYYLHRGKETGRKYFQIEQLVLNSEGQKDTLYNVNFEIYEWSDKNIIRLINFSFNKKNWSLQDGEILKSKSKLYRGLLRKKILSILESTKKED